LFWQTTVVAGAVWALSWLARGRSASFRYGLWMLVLARLVLPPGLSLPTGIMGDIRQPSSHSAGTGFPQRLEAEVTAAPSADAEGAFGPSMEVSEGRSSQRTAPGPAPSGSEAFSGVVSFSAPARGLPEADSARISPAAALFSAWIAGCGLFSLLTLWRFVRLRRLLGQARPVESGALFDLFRRCRERIPVPRGARCSLWLADVFSSPAVVGILRVRVLLPSRLVSTLTREELEPLILHELAHVKRWDVAVSWLQVFLQILHWHHPAVWFANRRIRCVREEACDDRVLAATGRKHTEYGSSLVKVLETSCGRPSLSIGLLGVGESYGALRHRLTRIMDSKRRVVSRLSFLSFLAICLLGAILLPARPSERTPAFSVRGNPLIGSGGAAEIAGATKPVEAPAPSLPEEPAPGPGPSPVPAALPPAVPLTEEPAPEPEPGPVPAALLPAVSLTEEPATESEPSPVPAALLPAVSHQELEPNPVVLAEVFQVGSPDLTPEKPPREQSAAGIEAGSAEDMSPGAERTQPEKQDASPADAAKPKMAAEESSKVEMDETDSPPPRSRRFAPLTRIEGAHTEEDTTTLPFEADGTLTLENNDGSVHVSAWDKPYIWIRAKKEMQVRRSGGVTVLLLVRVAEGSLPFQSLEEAQTYFDGFRARITGTRRHITVKTVSPRQWGRVNLKMSYEIRLPRAANVNVSSLNGSVTVCGIEGSVQVSGKNGELELADLPGGVEASTLNGEIAGRGLAGGVRLTTLNGAVELRRGTALREGERVVCESTNGAIRVFLPRASAFELEAETRNGKVSATGFEMVPPVRNSLGKYAGRAGNGGGRLNLRTSNGQVSVSGT
jgi:beta-lactamase regulating signal transducer with metallopeptidase domain